MHFTYYFMAGFSFLSNGFALLLLLLQSIHTFTVIFLYEMGEACCDGNAAASTAGAGFDLNQEAKPCCQMQMTAVVVAVIMIVVCSR